MTTLGRLCGESFVLLEPMAHDGRVHDNLQQVGDDQGEEDYSRLAQSISELTQHSNSYG